MEQRILKVRPAGNTKPPARAASIIKKIKGKGRNSDEKIWKLLVGTFTVVPTDEQFREKRNSIGRYYREDARCFRLSLRRKEKNPTIQIKVFFSWIRFSGSAKKYYIIVIIFRPGSGNTAVTPPKSPTAPPSPL